MQRNIYPVNKSRIALLRGAVLPLQISETPYTVDPDELVQPETKAYVRSVSEDYARFHPLNDDELTFMSDMDALDNAPNDMAITELSARLRAQTTVPSVSTNMTDEQRHENFISTRGLTKQEAHALLESHASNINEYREHLLTFETPITPPSDDTPPATT